MTTTTTNFIGLLLVISVHSLNDGSGDDAARVWLNVN